MEKLNNEKERRKRGSGGRKEGRKDGWIESEEKRDISKSTFHEKGGYFP